jgi:hypothetical protein
MRVVKKRPVRKIVNAAASSDHALEKIIKGSGVLLFVGQVEDKMSGRD